MGLWRTMWIMGTVGPSDLAVIEESELVPEINGRRDWLATEFDALGLVNGDLHGLDGILANFRWMLVAAPSLRAVAHVSPVYSDRGVEHTITIGSGGVVSGEPAIRALREETNLEAQYRLASWY